MNPTAVRVLPFLTADGPTNMAADEALLESAVGGVASLRFYAWSPPTLSLGYFQPYADRLGDPFLADLPVVRRATGGSALVHHHELTYALALPTGAAWQPPKQSWACRMHGIITAALGSLGVESRAEVCGREQKLGEALCFLHHTAGDVILDGRKLVGSAQRRQRGALLQHGGILLAQSPHAPRLPGIRELTGVELSAENLAAAVAKEFAREMGWRLVPSDWTETERRRTAELVRERYASDSWTLKR